MTEKELLLTALFNCKRSDLYTDRVSLDDKQKEILSSMLKRRKQGEPIQYITGFTEFMGLQIKVDRRVLIPRPETEILVEATLKLIKNNFNNNESHRKYILNADSRRFHTDGRRCYLRKSALDLRESALKNSSSIRINILDLCTGSGNIAISLAKSFDNVKIVSVDISGETLELARENANINNVSERVMFIKSNLFDRGFENRNNFFDIIVCNPPYLKTSELDQAAAELAFEPRIALDAGRDGLLFYKKIIRQAPQYLKKDGYLVFEIGFKQLKQIKKILAASNKFILENVIKDYNNIDRVIFLKKIS